MTINEVDELGGTLTPMYKGDVAEKFPTPYPRIALPAVMRARLDVVASCMITPIMIAIVPMKKTPLLPTKSLIGAAVSEPTSSPTLIMDVITARLGADISYSPFEFL